MKKLCHLIGLLALASFLMVGTNARALDDRDRDGLTDAYEVGISTDPFDADSDDDGMDDGWEDANGTDPLVDDAAADDDLDGLSNFGEYLMESDPLSPDSDGGGIDDGGEAAWGSDPTRGVDDDSGVESLSFGATTVTASSRYVVGNI